MEWTDKYKILKQVKDRVDDYITSMSENFDAARKISFPSSSMSSGIHIPEDYPSRNEGLLLFNMKYDNLSENLRLECIMEVNKKTIMDIDNQLTVRMSKLDISEIDDFVERKIDQFLEIFSEAENVAEEE